MGRTRTMDEWAHFEKLPEEGRVPNSTYWYVVCRHCRLAHEEHRLASAPARLTGRRSAMQAHLKSCPIYSSQYKLEQQDAGATSPSIATDTTEVNDDKNVESTTPNSFFNSTDPGDAKDVTSDVGGTSELTGNKHIGEKRRRRSEGGKARGGRGKHCMMEEWDHFIRLQDEGYIGNSNFFRCICKYCQEAHDNAPDEKKPSMVPEKLVGRREKMRKHLRFCPYFHGELPPLENRSLPRIASASDHAFTSVDSAFESIGDVDLTKNMETDGLTMPSAPPNISTELMNQAGVSPSSRLALAEWRYFTRLHRKEGSAYHYARCNFCQAAYEQAPDVLKANIRPTVIMGRKPNMQTHLAKCPHVPRGVLPKDVAPMLYLNQTIHAREYTPGALKRAKVEGKDMRKTLVDFTIQHELPFTWIEASASKDLLRLNADESLPTASDLRGPLLDDRYDCLIRDALTELRESPYLENDKAVNKAEASRLYSSSWPAVLEITDSCSKNGKLGPALASGDMYVPLDLIQPKHRNSVDSTPSNERKTTSFPTSSDAEVVEYVTTQLYSCSLMEHIEPSFVLLPYSQVMTSSASMLRKTRPNLIVTHDLTDLLNYVILKTLESSDFVSAVGSLVTLWKQPTVREAIDSCDPFDSITTCISFLEEVVSKRELLAGVDLTYFSDVDSMNVDWKLLERTSTMLSALRNAKDKCERREVGLADAVAHLGLLYRSSEGFVEVQQALEAIWGQLEQPLYVLAHALHPQLRLQHVNATDLTKGSYVSDCSAAYFGIIFGAKSSAIRGEVTSYLHKTKDAFSPSVVNEFAGVEDYFRYLNDDYPSLALLMRLLHSVRVSTLPAEDVDTRQTAYTDDERQKMTYIRQRCKLSRPQVQTNEEKELSAASINAMDGVRSEVTLVSDWIQTLQSEIGHRRVDFTPFEASGTADDGLESDGQVDRRQKISLQELFEATKFTT